MPEPNPQPNASPTSPPATAPAGGGAPPSGAGTHSPSPDSANGGAPAPTLADGGGEPEPQPSATPASWPANWRDIAAGGDTKALQYLSRYNSPANVVKALMATRQKISTGELLRTKPDGADEQALNEWRAQAGVPEKPEGYLEKLPGGLVIGEADQPRIQSFIQDMHAADAPPDLVHKALGWYYANQEKEAAERAEADRAFRAKAEDEMRADWGPDYRPQLNGIRNMLDSHGTPELRERLFGARMGDGTPLGDDPAALRFLSAIARELNPHGTVVPAAGQTATQTIDAEITVLEAEMAQAKNPPAGSYWKSDAKQARLRELYDMRTRHKARAG